MWSLYALFNTKAIAASPIGIASSEVSRSQQESYVRAKLMEDVKTLGKGMVPRAGVEPARPFGQRILSPVIGPLPNLTKRYKPVFTRLAVVNVSLLLA